MKSKEEEKKTLIRLRITARGTWNYCFCNREWKRENSHTHICVTRFESNESREEKREMKIARLWRNRVFLCAHIFRTSNEAVLQAVFFCRIFSVFPFQRNNFLSVFLIDMDKGARPIRSRKHSRFVRVWKCSSYSLPKLHVIQSLNHIFRVIFL